MPFEAYKIYEEYEPDKFKTSTQKKVEQALDVAQKEGLVPETKEAHVEFEEAQEIFGSDFLGPESVGSTFGVEFSQEELNQIENIPFTREELEKAKKLGMMLVLRVPRVGKDKTAKSLTIKQMRGVFKGEDKLGDPKKKKSQIFYDHDWYNKEEFATKDTPSLGWGLVTKKILEESRSKNWDQQQEVLKKWAEENGIDPTSIRRRTPVEIAYDTLLYYGSNKESLLADTWDWTGVRSSVGGFVFVGDFDSDGLHVHRATRGRTDSILGVCPSR